MVGLYDYGLRSYNPAVGGWMTEDPARAGLNWYAHVNNDPTDLIDPLGLAKTDAQASKSIVQRLEPGVDSFGQSILSTERSVDNAIISPLKSADPQLYLYTLKVNPDQVTPPRTVQPPISNVTDETLPGGGVEYVSTERIPMRQTQGVAVPNE